jgi:hypothetical protein
MTTVTALIDDPEEVAATIAPAPRNVGPTILGSELRRNTHAVVNGVSKGVYIEVKFLGTRAYTNGRRIVLPKIKDLAEIRYATARALMGYAIHEVAHVRYTDFKAIERIFEDPTVVAAFGTDDKREIVQRQKLIKKFENCIEDYRIEREMTREYPGTKSDLEALRTAIHPKLKTLTTGWFADPRSCGPLALTWLGARINGFQNPHLQNTLSHIPEAVMAMIDDWTERMTDVVDTKGAVDLAISFELEAQAYAQATREEAERLKREQDQAEKGPDAVPDQGVEEPVEEPVEQPVEQPEQSEGSDRDDDRPDEDDAGDEVAGDSDEKPSSDDAPAEPADDERAVEPEGDAPDADDDGQHVDDSGGGASDGGRDQSDVIDDAIANEDQSKPLDSDASKPKDADAASEPRGDAPDATDATDAKASDSSDDGKDGNGAAEEQSIDFKGDRREKQDSLNTVPDPQGARSGERKPEGQDEEGRVDLNGDLVDDYVDPAAERSDDDEVQQEGQGSSDDEGDAVDQIETDNAAEEDEAPRNGDASEVQDSCDTGGADDGLDGGTGGGAFDDVLDDDARLDDAISDMVDEIRDSIAAGEPLPQMTPEASDGEVDPSSLLDEISDSNEDAPDYDSSDSDPHPNDYPEEESRASRASQHYGDARFRNAPDWSEEGCRHEEMREKAAGATSTTARTIKRLLMAEEKSGFLSNRRSGDFDIRNVSAIARNTGTCYRRTWSKPAPRTLLVTLVDFSGSMEGDEEQEKNLDSPIAIAMTGALAIEQAVKGTSVNSAMYGFTGASPTVNMTVFKEGRQSEIVTRQRIGSFDKVDKRFTPTGEAMAAVAARMDRADEERRILLVLTDGMADDMQLCADVTTVLMRRGIEVVVIGIQDDSAEAWAPVHRTIHNLGQLPSALLATIDPRAAKRRRLRLAA